MSRLRGRPATGDAWPDVGDNIGIRVRWWTSSSHADTWHIAPDFIPTSQTEDWKKILKDETRMEDYGGIFQGKMQISGVHTGMSWHLLKKTMRKRRNSCKNECTNNQITIQRRHFLRLRWINSQNWNPDIFLIQGLGFGSRLVNLLT